ncbi:MAG: hypothetical protein KDE51_15630, partial [Anaerolineales bacterium]|nr:hypothetical protein [Anaerolineales bacterium]
MSRDDQFNLDDWIDKLEAGDQSDHLVQLAQQLENSRPAPPTLSPIQQQGLWNRVWQQYQAPFGIHLFTSKLIGVGSAIVFGLTIVAAVALQNPSADTASGTAETALVTSLAAVVTETVTAEVSPTVTLTAVTETAVTETAVSEATVTEAAVTTTANEPAEPIVIANTSSA